MGDGLNQKRCLTQEQIFNVNNKKILFPCTKKGSHFEDKRKVEHSSGQPFLEPSCEFGQNACIEHVIQFESLENNRKSKLGSKMCNDGELVKHMSNLPGFLQQVEKQKSIQEKALNFGVLDWRRLEKWKYNERMPAKCHRKTSSSISGSVCMPSGQPKMGPNLRKQPSSHGLNPSLLSPGKQPMPHSSCSSSPQRKPPPLQSYSSHLNSCKMERKEIDCMEENDFRGVKESKKKETHKGELQATQSSNTERPENFYQKVESCDRSCSKKHVKSITRKETVSERKISSLEQGKLKFSVSLNDTISGQGKENGKNLDDAVEYTSEFIPVQSQNVLIIPKHFPKRSCSKSSRFSGSSSSLDMQLAEAIGNTFSDVIPPQKSREFSVDIPQSRFLPAGARVHAECSMEPHNFVTSQAVDLDNCRSTYPEVDSVIPMPSEGKCSFAREKAAAASLSVHAPKRSGVDIVVQPTVQGRHSTPTQRFRFGLGKMDRSSSFKESSAVPQLRSTYTAVKSCQVTEISSGMDNFDKDKANASSKGRSSPLRRLLDPLLKHRGSQSTEIFRPPSGTIHSMAFRTPATKGPSHDRKQEGLTCRGFLQLTLKNGLPFFKLVVDNSSSSDMLAAVVKRLPLFGKSDHSMIYEFYSVHEIKKKSMTWIQGSKNKRCGLGYNILGQMKILNFYLPKSHSNDSSQCVVRECVLYGVDKEQVDEQVLDVLPDKEIAAVVLTYSREKLNDGVLCDDKRSYQERGFPHCGSGSTDDTGGEENCNSTVVIIPGGVHGIPSKGAPSSLISRWRSGGSCDCGGWDDGCKLRVLTNNKKNGKISQSSVSSSAIDHVNLFIQGGEEKGQPVFNLEASRNGFYSLEFDPSICLLEAFATSVAFITSHKLSKILDGNSPEHNIEAMIGTNKIKIPTITTFQGQVPAKYVTCPPSSPAGRI